MSAGTGYNKPEPPLSPWWIGLLAAGTVLVGWLVRLLAR